MGIAEIQKVLENSLQVDYICGSARKRFGAHEQDRRLLPFLVFVYAPSKAYLLQRQGEDPCIARNGQVVLAPAGIRHRIAFAEGGFLSGLHIQFTILGGLDVLSLFDVPTLVGGARARKMGSIQASLVRSHAETGPLSLRATVERMALSYRLLDEILAVSDLRPDASNRLQGLDRVQPALEHIERHLDADLTRDALASCSNLSPARFNTVFREAMGVPPMTYVRKLRMRHAMRLLRQGGVTVSEVAHALGYCDPFHFSRQFKVSTGMSPSVWRERLGNALREIVP